MRKWGCKWTWGGGGQNRKDPPTLQSKLCEQKTQSQEAMKHSRTSPGQQFTAFSSNKQKSRPRMDYERIERTL